MREKLLFSSSKDIERAYGHYLILSRAISRVSSQLSWIEDTIQQWQKQNKNWESLFADSQFFC